MLEFIVSHADPLTLVGGSMVLCILLIITYIVYGGEAAKGGFERQKNILEI